MKKIDKVNIVKEALIATQPCDPDVLHAAVIAANENLKISNRTVYNIMRNDLSTEREKVDGKFQYSLSDAEPIEKLSIVEVAEKNGAGAVIVTDDDDKMTDEEREQEAREIRAEIIAEVNAKDLDGETGPQDADLVDATPSKSRVKTIKAVWKKLQAERDAENDKITF